MPCDINGNPNVNNYVKVFVCKESHGKPFVFLDAHDIDSFCDEILKLILCLKSYKTCLWWRPTSTCDLNCDSLHYVDIKNHYINLLAFVQIRF